MGSLSMATPRSRYGGAFSETNDPPSTSLAASSSDEDVVCSL
eukprot:CAMPEP_0197442934 /NCGR_PEP_ID=MMETSP1175-20131217/8825_1 /TAXON_ID=1003142 /ORGANISM="Triceratium dubium, Strain CCMP147" /LENGTH=41 /DNA_ID= /DNA_START= /DNA_END= /DNA_ORIENTATION=